MLWRTFCFFPSPPVSWQRRLQEVRGRADPRHRRAPAWRSPARTSRTPAPAPSPPRPCTRAGRVGIGSGGRAMPEKDGCEGKDSPGGERAPSHSQADESVCDPAHSSLPLYEGLTFCASCNSDRIYLYTKEGSPLNCNFIPMDIKLDSWEDLPEAFPNGWGKQAAGQWGMGVGV
ncbi:hypothetical protein ANANG_G00273400 [Anguilla anguilla]|uniref:Uncharacterized protein n=1 Tax=Anguilla anguilla TaxID=7936 RepID=A0A9D3RMK9_ANGAN|nr:hypothetical protein ANANG_G00273400 [Anguilla anguilla]